MLARDSFSTYPSRLFYFITFIAATACSSKSSVSDIATDTIHADTTSSTVLAEIAQVQTDEGDPNQSTTRTIRYGGANEDGIRQSLETFYPFWRVNEMARKSIRLKDSLESIRQSWDLTEEDSAVFGPVQEEAYRAIVDYTKSMADGSFRKDPCPSLLELTRDPLPEDSSSNYLAAVQPSDFLSHGKFFFIGGAPFIYKVNPEDNTIFKDSQGKPELHFATSITENASYFPHSIFQFTNSKINVEYGGPLNSYDTGPLEVRGIGSLIHNFVNPVAGFFITERGLVPCRVMSIRIKLVPEYLGCVSDNPSITFACSENIEENEILGIYIPYGTPGKMSIKITRPARDVWTADLNNDNVDDLAFVSGGYQGEASGQYLTDAIWFVNINGKWKVIDAGSELDCT